MSVFGWQTFPALRSLYGIQVTSLLAALSQPTRPTQVFHVFTWTMEVETIKKNSYDYVQLYGCRAKNPWV